MSKRVEQRALEAYPKNEKYTLAQRLIINDLRDGFIQGYEQAIKDVIALIDSNFLPALGGKIIRLIEQEYE